MTKRKQRGSGKVQIEPGGGGVGRFRKLIVLAWVICMLCIQPLSPEKRVPDDENAKASETEKSKTVDPLQARRIEIATQLSQVTLMGGDYLGYAESILDMLQDKFEIEPDLPEAVKSKLYRKRLLQKIGEQNPQSNLPFTDGFSLRRFPEPEEGPDEDSENVVPLSELENQVRGGDDNSPYKELLKGKESTPFKLAAKVPFDNYYFHFNKPERAGKIIDYISESVAEGYRQYNGEGVKFNLKTRIMEQLGLTDKGAGNTLGLVEEIALAGVDLSSFDALDLSLLFQVKKNQEFTVRLKVMRNLLLLRYGAKSKDESIGGVAVNLLSTADRRLHSYMFTLPGDLVVITNSRNAAERIIMVHQKKLRSIRDTVEFQFARASLPADRAKEDAFLYVSRYYLANLMSARVRIGQKRRKAEARRMAALERYALYYYHLHGKKASRIEDLRGEIPAEKMEVFKGLQLGANGLTAVHPQMGRIGWMVPGVDLNFLKVSQAEADSYREFSGSFMSMLNDPAFPPIGIRLRYDRTFEVEMSFTPPPRVMKDYQEVRKYLGGTPVILRTQGDFFPGEVMSLGVRLNPELLKQEGSPLEFVEKQLFPDPKKALKIADILGDEVQFHLVDTEPLIDYDPAAMSRQLKQAGPNFNPNSPAMVGMIGAVIGPLVNAFFRPFRVAVKVRDEKKALQLLDAIEDTWVKDIDMLGNKIGLERYFVKMHGKDVRVLKLSFSGITLRLYYGVYNGYVHLTTKKFHMKRMMAALGGGAPRPRPVSHTPAKASAQDEEPSSGCLTGLFGGSKKETARPAQIARVEPRKAVSIKDNPKDTVKSNIVGIYRPSQLDLEKDMLITRIMEGAKDASFANFGTYYMFHKIFGDKAPGAQGEYGFQIECPAGGSYSVDPKTGKVVSSAFGTKRRPYLDQAKILNQSLFRFFKTEYVKGNLALEETRVRLYFSAKGR